MSLILAKPGHLPRTGPVDWVDRYHSGVIGAVLRQRLVWVLSALPSGRVDRILEIGCGSGVLQYSLGPRSRFSAALDFHPMLPAVRDALAADGLHPALVRADGATLPFADQSFDVVVVVSTLEFVPDPAGCLHESRRVLRPGGRLVCLIPRRFPWADAMFRTITGQDPEEEFRGGRERAARAVATELPDAARLPRPTIMRFAAPYLLIVLDVPANSSRRNRVPPQSDARPTAMV